MNQATSFEVDGRTDLARPRLARPIVVTDDDEREFQRAMDDYKRRSGRSVPTWSEILEVLRSVGYEKRIWRPVTPEPPSGLVVPIPGGLPESTGVDPVTGLLCWFSRVETAVGW